MNRFNKNDIIELEIESLALGGKGVTHLKGFTIFIERSLPGQKVKAKITRQKNNYAEARVVEIISRSPKEVSPRCPYFGVCGGCLIQNLDYEEQLAQKQRQIAETLKHIGGFPAIEMLSILPSPEIFYYRNKMEFSFARRRWLTAEEINRNEMINKELALGLHVSKIYDKILDIKQCFLLSERSNDLIDVVRNYARQSKLQPYTTINHTGFWRFLVIRESKHLDQVMVNFVTADHPDGCEVVESLSYSLIARFPFITTIVHNINRKKAQIACGDEEHVIFGPGYIEEKLGKRTFRISANSFFQTNTFQAERMYQCLSEWGKFEQDQIVYDLYSGTGGIAICIADQVKKVVGFELISQAIADAKINCQINAIDNCEFLQGDLKDNLANPQQVVEKFGKPAVIIIDPPRSGMHPKLPERILQLAPQKIIYVSCNPATLARDLSMLCYKDFTPITVQPVDMFPHTAHCEVMVLLERSNT